MMAADPADPKERRGLSGRLDPLASDETAGAPQESASPLPAPRVISTLAAGSTHGSRDTGKPMARRRGRMTAVLQARVTATEHQVLEQLARRRGLSMSDAVRAG